MPETNEKALSTNTPPVAAGAPASPAPASSPAGKSLPAGKAALPALPETKPPRFTITATTDSGPVQTFAEVDIDDDGVGTTNNPTSAYHCVCSGYAVADAMRDGQPYDGTAPKPAKVAPKVPPAGT